MRVLDQNGLLAARLMFSALALGDNLTDEDDRRVRQAFTSGPAIDHIAWVDNIRIGNIVNGGFAGTMTILGLKLCP